MKKLIVISLTAFLVFFALNSEAQAGGPPPPPDSTSGPIDKGAVVLLVAVAAYGYLRLKQKEQQIV